VTKAGVERGQTTTSILSAVLGLTGIPMESERVQLPTSPARDPFRRRA
jgi:hypothetical protein